MEPVTRRRVGGRYELVRRIARGGGGTVWQATDETLGRPVAVKEVEIPDELSDEERVRLRRRVLAEARAAARLDHPGAVVVHDVIDDGDVVHLVMEYVAAPTLRQRVQEQGPLPEAAAAALGFGLLEVLSEAHRRGVVHRDVKPSNVFVLDDGTVKLADFGIAALAGEVSLTRTGVALGSPSYLAPEQARGEAAAPPADLWGLGATLYFAVEGAPPFERRTPLATVHAVVNEPARPFERADAMRDTLTALLRKDPAARPDADRVREQLATVAGIPASAMTLAADDVAATVAGPVGAAVRGPANDDTPPLEAEGRTVTGGSAGRRRSMILAAVAMLAIVAALVFVLGGDDGTPDEADPPVAQGGSTDEASPDTAERTPADDETTEDATEDAPDDATDEATGDAGDAGADEAPTDDAATGTTEPADGNEDAPAGDESFAVPESDPPGDWQVVEGATYRVAVPPDWQERAADGNRTDWVDPETGAYLRVDWTDDPASDPVADWEAAEAAFAQRQSDYERVRLQPATYRDWDAAMWEYTYASGGASLQAINLNVLADDLGHAYALNLQAPAGNWDEVAQQFPAIAGSFEPTVGG
ncbi:protein kinase [Egicoccus sp. AB-alg2]|uniref:serine/threonine-protein kinase n=1 Tax=Egicoccus sp. AB-alg2 TaxID=3242693 RepID=UPI00359D26F8